MHSKTCSCRIHVRWGGHSGSFPTVETGSILGSRQPAANHGLCLFRYPDRPRQSEGHALTSPHELALAYNRYVAALWRGEEAEARVFASWLAGYWVEEGPPEMADQPHAVSMLGGAGAGIRWYTRGGTIVGYVGCHVQGCFHVPIDAAPPPTQLGRQQT
jgi:hypothetical protein